MRKAMFFIFTITMIFPYLISPALADDPKAALAVESIGEINAKDNSSGTVLAGLEAHLIMTLIADMSQAEPGEEIESIQITVPSGFTVKEGAVTAVRTSEKEIPNFEAVVDRNRITVVLPTLIILSTVITIEFTVDAPPTPVSDRSFIVSLLNILKNPIIIAVKSGNADGRINNDSFVVRTAAATKPDPPGSVDAQPDVTGENDIVISWTKSEDPVVSGYFVFRSDNGNVPIVDITSSEQTVYIDRSLNPGDQLSYTVRSYKTQTLRSDPSNASTAVVPADTKLPEPPVVQSEVTVTEDGLEIVWELSTSQDVEKYVVYRGASLDSREPIAELPLNAVSYLDETPPTAGSFLYVVVAVDDVGNESVPSATQLRQVLSGAEPQPNPFTPLSTDPRFNQVTFPAALVEGGEGPFAVKVMDLEGDVVFDEETPEGSKEIKWDGKDLDGETVDAGIYIYQATMGIMNRVGTIVVAK